MNESQRRTLRIHAPDLTRDLELNADLVARFLHHGIFNEDMIEDIKSEKTRKERIQKMLLLLPRRGPRAFDMFTHAIQDTYPWLAEDLRKTHHKIALKTEPEMLTLKEKVDIYVHEQFGNKKRLSEEDKKDIRKFLYKHLKNPDKDPLGHLDSRRNSLDSTAEMPTLENHSEANAKDTENNILQKVYAMLNREISTVESDECESVVSETEEITIEMIESKVNELNKNVEDLQNEIKGCFSVLGLQNCEYSLHDVLETYTEKREQEKEEFANMKHKLDRLERKRNKLEETLRNKEQELKDTMNNLANSTHETEKAKYMVKELENKCERLETIHVKHVEKQNTLMTLKSMVKDLSPLRRTKQEHNHIYAYDDVDGHGDQEDISKLPKISKSHSHLRKSRSLRSHATTKSRGRERSTEHHHEVPLPACPPIGRTVGNPWKY